LYDDSGSEIRCSLRGRFQKEFQLKRNKLFNVDIVVVGDRVIYELNEDGTGVIEEILPRKNYISRKATKIKGVGNRGERLEQVVASNIDNLIIVSSCKFPKFNNRVIDRLIVAGESSQIEIIIVINKTDLDDSSNYELWVKLYREIGYKVFLTSVKTKAGIDALKKVLSNRINLIWGHSGVGKSSLINEMYSEMHLKIGEISTNTSKGKHTTVTSIMKKVDDNTYIIDTPGIREIDPYGIREEDVSHYFKEFIPFLKACRFNTCTHHHEPGCGVISAVEQGRINGERYQSYLNILDTIEEDMNF
jgi:ribosome biogenesis GTPase